VEGIGSDCITEALHPGLVDEVVSVTDADAFETARSLARSEGISVGGSTGAAVWAARQAAKNLDDKAVMVIIAPDSGTKYLSKCFNDTWMRDQGFLTEESKKKKLEV